MRMKYLAAAVFAATASHGVAVAQDFQMEGGLSYTDLDFDAGDDSVLGIDFTYHFNRVNTQGHPLAEAGFLERSSNLSVAFATFDESDADILSAELELYLNQLYLAASADRFSNGGSSTDYGLRVGFLPRDGLRLTLGFDQDDTADVDTISLGAKYVMKMIGDTALNLEGELGFVDDDADTMILDLSADYYFTRLFSAGVRVRHLDNDFTDDTGVGVGARYFFTPTLSGEVEYFTDDFSDAILLRVAARFG